MPAEIPTTGPLLTPANVADHMGVRVQTLARWRCRGVGPPFIRVEHGAYYREAAFFAWLNAPWSADDMGLAQGLLDQVGEARP